MVAHASEQKHIRFVRQNTRPAQEAGEESTEPSGQSSVAADPEEANGNPDEPQSGTDEQTNTTTTTSPDGGSEQPGSQTTTTTEPEPTTTTTRAEESSQSTTATTTSREEETTEHSTTTTPQTTTTPSDTTSEPETTTSSSLNEIDTETTDAPTTSTTRTTTSRAGVSTITSVSTETTNGASSTSSTSGTALPANDNSDGTGVSTGAIIGIVAGVILGVVVLASIVGYFWRRRNSNDDFDESPFERQEFRRTSHILEDDNTGFNGRHSPHMSEYSLTSLDGGVPGPIGVAGGGAAGMHMAANSRNLPGLERNGSLSAPRPPSSILSHYSQQQRGFQPGQIMPAGYGGAGYGYPNNGYYAGPDGPMVGQAMSGPVNGQAMYAQYHQSNYNQNLERNASIGSSYSQSNVGLQRSPSDPRSEGHQYVNHNKRLGDVTEETETMTPSRTGTPVNHNVQQSYYAFDPANPNSSRLVGSDHGHGHSASLQSDNTFYETKGEPMGGKLSVRNADAYGGVQ